MTSLNNRILSLYILPIVILIISIILRILYINHESFWNDELSSLYRSSYETISEVISVGVAPDVHPPGYQILLFFVEKSLGTSEFALRLPSAIAGVITVFLTFCIGRMLFRKGTALLGAAMLAVSPMHIWLSQEARPYSILIMLVALSIYLMLMYIAREKNQAGYHLLLLISINFILLEYIHYFGLLVYALQGIFLFINSVSRRRDRIVTVFCLTFPVLAYIPWIPVMLTQSSGDSYINAPGIMSFIYLFIEYCSWSKALLAIFTLSLILPVKAALSKGLVHGEGLKTVILWIAVPIAAAFFISVVAMPVFTNRNLMIALPAVLLLQAYIVVECIRNNKLRILIGSAILGLMLVQLFFIRKHYTEPHRNQFREAALYTVEHLMDTDSTVILVSAWNTAYFDYYFHTTGKDIEIDYLCVSVEDFTAVKELIENRHANDAWLLWGHLEPDCLLIDSLSAMFSETDYEPLLGAGVWHFIGRE